MRTCLLLVSLFCASLHAEDRPAAASEPAAPRMVVASFRAANGDTFSWCGKPESTAMWTAAVADKITERLVQSRRFTMIDRKFDAEVQDEIARLSAKSAAKADMIRLGQRIGTDYMVVGEAKFFTIQAPAANPITGQSLPMASQRFADIGYRLIYVPTGLLKWAGTVSLDASLFPVADMPSFVSASTDCAAQQIVDAVVGELFPSACRRSPAAPCAGGGCNAPVAPVAAPLNTSVRGTGNGGVVTPF